MPFTQPIRTASGPTGLHPSPVDEAGPQPAPAPVQALIAESHGLVRAGLRVLLEDEADISVVAEAASGESAVEAALRFRPDVVLMDLELPGLDGLEATRRILADVPAGHTRVVMLLPSGSDEAVFEALRAGATGVLLKDAGPDELISAVHVVARGEAVLAPTLTRRLLGEFLARPERLSSTPEELDELTAREREVVALVACGLSNAEIAERLVVTPATAKTHVSRALCKLHARDRAQLVVLAYESGLVRPGPQRAEMPARTYRFARPVAATTARRAHLQPLAA